MRRTPQQSGSEQDEAIDQLEKLGISRDDVSLFMGEMMRTSPRIDRLNGQFDIYQLALESARENILYGRTSVETLTQWFEVEESTEQRLGIIDRALAAVAEARLTIPFEEDKHVYRILPESVTYALRAIGLDVANHDYKGYFRPIISGSILAHADDDQELAGQRLALVRWLRDRGDSERVRQLVEGDPFFQAGFEEMRSKIPMDNLRIQRKQFAIARRVGRQVKHPDVVAEWERLGIVTEKQKDAAKMQAINTMLARELNLEIVELNNGRPFALSGVRAEMWDSYRQTVGAGWAISDAKSDLVIRTILITAPAVLLSGGVAYVAARVAGGVVEAVGVTSAVAQTAVRAAAFIPAFAIAEHGIAEGELLTTKENWDAGIVQKKMARAALMVGVLGIGAVVGKKLGIALVESTPGLIPAGSVRASITVALAQGHVEGALFMILAAVEHYKTVGSFRGWNTLDQLFATMVTLGVLKVAGRSLELGKASIELSSLARKVRARREAKIMHKQKLKRKTAEMLEGATFETFATAAKTDFAMFLRMCKQAKKIPVEASKLLEMFNQGGGKLKNADVLVRALSKSKDILDFATAPVRDVLAHVFAKSLNISHADALAGIGKIPRRVLAPIAFLMFSGCGLSEKMQSAGQAAKYMPFVPEFVSEILLAMVPYSNVIEYAGIPIAADLGIGFSLFLLRLIPFVGPKIGTTPIHAVLKQGARLIIKSPGKVKGSKKKKKANDRYKLKRNIAAVGGTLSIYALLILLAQAGWVGASTDDENEDDPDDTPEEREEKEKEREEEKREKEADERKKEAEKAEEDDGILDGLEDDPIFDDGPQIDTTAQDELDDDYPEPDPEPEEPEKPKKRESHIIFKRK